MGPRSDHRAGELDDDRQNTPAEDARRWDWICALRMSELDPTARLVAFALSFRMESDGTRAHPGPTLLARESGLSVRSVKAKLQLLERAGWLKCVHRGRSTATGGRTANRYRATIPTGAARAPVQEVTGAARSTTGASGSRTRARAAPQTFSTPDETFAHARATDLVENWATLYDDEHELRTAVATELHLAADHPALDEAITAWRSLRAEGAA